mmetsp:Transcript_3204/g.9277  ORF Transcript_3204/g.9277 Transcript_3204/m.9277 type:complete len:208 (+) Transcript_3204:3290-3913(+)
MLHHHRQPQQQTVSTCVVSNIQLRDRVVTLFGGGLVRPAVQVHPHNWVQDLIGVGVAHPEHEGELSVLLSQTGRLGKHQGVLPQDGVRHRPLGAGHHYLRELALRHLWHVRLRLDAVEVGSVDSVSGVLPVWAVDAADKLEAPSDLVREIRLTGHERVTHLSSALEGDYNLGVQRLERLEGVPTKRGPLVDGVLNGDWQQQQPINVA